VPDDNPPHREPETRRVGAETRRVGAETRTLGAVAVGGALGALTRYEVALAIPTGTDGFPWSTWLINVSGSLFLGFLLTVLAERRTPTRYVRPFLGTGFTGGYTTWSTFVVDADLLVHHGHPVVAVVYVAATLVAGLGAVVVGVWGTRRLPISRLTPLPSSWGPSPRRSAPAGPGRAR
jgi:fluoride exporter